MFPTVSHLLEYIGIEVALPLPTFGLFVALAFILSYLTFLSEFKRKEREGVIKPIERLVLIGQKANLKDYAEYGLLGFILGFKFIGSFIDAQLFLRSPLKFIFSLQGSLIFGLLLCAAFCYLVYWQNRKEQLNPPVPTKIHVHPYQLMPKLMIWAAVWGFLGAKIFNFLEHIQQYSAYSLNDFLRYSGLTFLGGLVFGAISYLYIGYRHGMKLIDLADIGSPGMLVAYGVGRVGCHLSGDGDWGIVNNADKPFAWLPDWMWSFNFPHNVLNKGEYISGCAGKYCSVLPKGVFPTSFYEAVLILGCFTLLWFNRKKIKLPGLMFSLYLLTIGVERLLMENIKVNYKYRLLGCQLSEAQLISLAFVVLGLGLGFYVLLKRKKT